MQEKKNLPPKLEKLEKFHEWKKMMQLHFKRHSAWLIVLGQEVAPTRPSGDNVDAYEKKLEKFNERIAGAHLDLINCLTGQMKELALDSDNVVDAWKQVSQICDRDKEAEMLQLQAEFVQLSSSSNMVDTLTKFQTLVRKLEVLGSSITENEKAVKLLSLLPRSDAEFIVQVKTTNEFRNVSGNYDFEKLLSMVQKRAVVNLITVPDVKLESTSSAVMEAKRNVPLKCSICKKTGHGKYQCDLCWNCKKPGHKSMDCKLKKKVKCGKKDESPASPPGADAVKKRAMMGKRGISRKLLIDSGATNHCCNNRDLMTAIEKIDKPYEIETLNSTVVVSEIGSLECQLTNGTPFTMANVAHDRSMADDLILSVPQITDLGWEVHMKKREAFLYDPDGELFAVAKKGESNLFWLDCVVSPRFKSSVKMSKEVLWHKRFGHASFSVLNQMRSKQSVDGWPGKLNFDPGTWCDACGNAKLVQKITPKVTEDHKFEATSPFEKLHVDTVGPFPNGGPKRVRFLVHLVDDFSKYKWVVCCADKEIIPIAVSELIRKLQNVLGKKLKNLKSDLGTEFWNAHLKGFCKEHGIMFDSTSTGRKPQHGAVERANRTLQEGMIAMLVDSGLGKYFWPYAARTFTYLSNRIGTRLLEFKTPFELMWGKAPRIDHLRVFGCRGFALDGTKRKKLEPRARPARFLGYNTETRSYDVWWLDSNSIGTSRSATFDEMNQADVVDTAPDLQDLISCIQVSDVASQHEEGNSEQVDPENVNNEDDVPPENENVENVAGSIDPENATDSGDYHSIDFQDSIEDYHSAIDGFNGGESEEGNHGANQPRGSWCNVDERNIIHGSRRAKMAAIPKKFHDIFGHDEQNEWLESYHAEVRSLESIAKMEVVKRSEVPAGKQILPILELFTVKSDGRKKTRIVVRGDLQKRFPDDLYAPTASAVAVRTVVGVAASFGLKLHQLDVKNAYLNGKIDEEIFLELPQGHARKAGKELVYKTVCSIYGLKEAPKVWNQRLHSFLCSLGFKNCPVEKCLYRKDGFYLVVYVDDILFCSFNEKEVDDFKAKISEEFEVKFEQEVTKFLGFEIVELQNGIFLSQQKFAEKILNEFGLSDAKVSKVPMIANLDLESNNAEKMKDPRKFQALLGSLLYLNMHTRPDICFAVNSLSRKAKDPTETHFKLLKQVARYIKGTLNLGIFYERSKELVLSVHVDSSWAGGDGRKSVHGFVVSIGNAPLIFKTKLQSIVALSSTEAEYIGLSAAVKELCFVKNLFDFFNLKVRIPIEVFNDNQSALKIGRNMGSVGRTKHIQLRFFHVQDLVQKGLVDLKYERTDEMRADMLTKSLGSTKFVSFRDKLLQDM